MARRVKHDAAPAADTATGSRLDHAEFKRVLLEADRQSGLASEYAGSAGKVLRDAIDRMSLNRKGVQITRSLNKLDDAKRHETIRCTLEYWEAAGFFDQTDAFSDITDQLRGLLDRLTGRIPNRERDDPTLAALTR